MKLWQRENIRENLSKLVKHTQCSNTHLNRLYSAKIIDHEDLEKLEVLNTSTAKSTMLYRILLSRVGAYEKLIEALNETNQSGALETLGISWLPLPQSDLQFSGAAAGRDGKIHKYDYKYEIAIRHIKKITQVQPLESGVALAVLYYISVVCVCVSVAVIASFVKFFVELKQFEPVTFNVHPAVDLFTGRDTELETLHQMITRNDESPALSSIGRVTVISQIMTSVTGLGGIGKTQLARKYIQEKGNKYFDGNVIWLNAETEASLSDAFHELAEEKLGLPTIDLSGAKKPIKSLVGKVYDFFKDRKVLFVFDNAERLPWLKLFLPLDVPKLENFYILLTSRDRECERGMEIFNLKELPVKDAVKFVAKGLGLVENSLVGDVPKLVERLQYFPLALQQAISYINEQQQMGDFSIQDYLQEFEKIQEELLSFEDPNLIQNDYTKTTFTTWKITVEKIWKYSDYGPTALQILNCMAYMNPVKIQRSIFYNLNNTYPEVDLKKVNYAVKLLVKYSMIDSIGLQHKQNVLSVHRLVQEVSRINLGRKAEEEEKTLEKVLNLLRSKMINLKQRKAIIDHSMTAWRYALKYPELVRCGAGEIRFIFNRIIASHKDDFGLLKKAVVFGHEVLKDLEKELRKSDVNCLLFIHSAIGRIVRRLEKFEKVKTVTFINTVLDDRDEETMAKSNNGEQILHLPK